MFDAVLFSKIVISILTVLGLSWLTERVSARLAGLVSGYPIGTAIALYFIGYEQGVTFAADGSIYTLAGLGATLTLAAGYFLGSMFGRGLASVAVAAVTSLLAFFLACLLLRQFELGLGLALLAPVAAILFYSWLFRNVPNKTVAKRAPMGFRVILFRAVLAAAVVVAVTGTAAMVGPEWAGLFSAFPSTAFPLLLIIHGTYGPGPVHTIIRNYPRGMGALVAYSISVSLTYPVLGVNWGTLVSFGFATLYLVAYALTTAGLERRRALSS